MNFGRTVFYGFLVLLALALAFYKKGDHAKEKGNGKVSQRETVMPPFSSIELEGSVKAVVRQTDQYRVKVETDENLQKEVQVQVINGALKVEVSRKARFSKLTVYVDCPGVDQVQGSGAVEFKVDGQWKAEKLSVRMSGGSKLDIRELNAETLHTDLSGASEVLLGGRARQASFDMSGACQIKASEMAADRISLSVSGAASARVHADSVLSVTISGAGSVVYSGNPEVKKHISGAGSVQQVKGNQER